MVYVPKKKFACGAKKHSQNNAGLARIDSWPNQWPAKDRAGLNEGQAGPGAWNHAGLARNDA